MSLWSRTGLMPSEVIHLSPAHNQKDEEDFEPARCFTVLFPPALLLTQTPHTLGEMGRVYLPYLELQRFSSFLPSAEKHAGVACVTASVDDIQIEETVRYYFSFTHDPSLVTPSH